MTNILRTYTETPQGNHLIDAEHSDGKIIKLKVHPVVQGVVDSALSVELEDWSELIKKLENLLIP